MTAQINDKLSFNKSDLDIVAIENPESFFDFSKLGLSPIATCSACWRGYIAIFAIDKDNNLILKHLYTNNDDKEPPIINGVEAFEINDWQENMYALAGNLAYENINLPIPYTGSFLIGDNFIDAYVLRLEICLKKQKKEEEKKNPLKEILKIFPSGLMINLI